MAFGSVSGDTLTLFSDSTNKHTLAFNQISSIERHNRTKYLGRGALLGGLSGAGVALLAGLVSCEDEYIPGFAVFGLIAGGAGAGMGIALAIPHNELLYSKHSRTTVSFAPVVYRTRKGAAVSVSWR